MNIIHKEGLVPLVEFAKEHDITKNNLYIMHSNKSPLLIKQRGDVLFDTTALYNRKEFRRNVWLMSHEYYYELMEYFGSENKFAIWLSKYSKFNKLSWVDFLASKLFAMPSDSLLSYKVPDRLWFFFRACRMVLRYRDRRVKRIYERLPNRDTYDERDLRYGFQQD